MTHVDELLGDIDPEYHRVAAVHKCREVLSMRGWQTGEADAKCLYDVFAVKGDRLLRIQVRSSLKLSRRGYPRFKTARILFNTKRVMRTTFQPGDFDLWFFYNPEKGCWLIPFEFVTQKCELSMEKYDAFKLEGWQSGLLHQS